MNLDDEDFGLDKNSELYRLLKMLKNERDNDAEDFNKHKAHESLIKLAENQEDLGPPHSEERYKEGDLTITVKTWFVDGGEIKNVDVEGDDDLVSQEDLEDKIAQIIKENGDLSVIGVDINRDSYELSKGGIVPIKSLEDLLEDVVKREDYVLAAKIRDDIKKRDELINEAVNEAKQKIEEGNYNDAKILLERAVELEKRGYKNGY